MSAPRFLDELAKVAGGTMSFVSSAREQVKDGVRNKIDDIAERMDLVPREEFEKLEIMLQQSRLKQEDLEKRIIALESAAKTAKPAAKKTTKEKK